MSHGCCCCASCCNPSALLLVTGGDTERSSSLCLQPGRGPLRSQYAQRTPVHLPFQHRRVEGAILPVVSAHAAPLLATRRGLDVFTFHATTVVDSQTLRRGEVWTIAPWSVTGSVMVTHCLHPCSVSDLVTTCGCVCLVRTETTMHAGPTALSVVTHITSTQGASFSRPRRRVSILLGGGRGVHGGGRFRRKVGEWENVDRRSV